MRLNSAVKPSIRRWSRFAARVLCLGSPYLLLRHLQTAEKQRLLKLARVCSTRLSWSITRRIVARSVLLIAPGPPEICAFLFD